MMFWIGKYEVTNEEFADSVDRLAADRHMETALRLSDI